MAQSYSEVVRTVRLYASTAPLFLVREWINDAYKDLTRSRNWSFLRGEMALTIAAARALAAVTVTLGSTTVTSAGLFVAADAGRQFAVGTYPLYTVQSVPDANTIILDRAYAGDTGAPTTAKIFDGYAVMPADFGSFRVIADTYNRRRLAFWIHEDELNLVDPARDCSDSGPRVLVAASPSTFTATAGRIRYEYWPQPTSARYYPALYNKQADALSEVDTFTGVLADGGDVLVTGALAKAAEWPGTPDVRNPYFNANLAVAKRGEFLDKVQKLALKDDAHYGDDLIPVDWASMPLSTLAYDATGLRATDATLADYFA